MNFNNYFMSIPNFYVISYSADGLLIELKLVIVILDLLLTIFPVHRRGLKALIGAIEILFEFKLVLGHVLINYKQYYLQVLIPTLHQILSFH